MKIASFPASLFILDNFAAPDKAGNQTQLYGATQQCRWMPLTIRFALTTDATVANRYPYIEFTGGGQIIAKITSVVAQTASLSVQWSFVAGMNDSQLIAAQACVIGLPPFPILNGNETITIGITNGVAGDTFSNIRFRSGLIIQPDNI